MDEALAAWCARSLGSTVAEVLFEAGSLSTVVGVRLADDREVVVKARRSAPRLRAAYLVHRHVWQHGYPAPEPLVPPTPLSAAETASAEALVRGGELGGRGAEDATRSAQALAALIGIAASAGDVGSLAPSPSWVAWDHDGPGPWPDDLPAGPAWLDDAAARCRARLRRYRAPRVIGHADWHADNVRWSAGSLLVVHDWDSLVSQPEAVIAGIAAAIFPASGARWQPATVAESEHFLSAYIRASTRPWTPDDTEAFWAASAWTLAADAKEAVSNKESPTLTETEILERLALSNAGPTAPPTGTGPDPAVSTGTTDTRPCR